MTYSDFFRGVAICCACGEAFSTAGRPGHAACAACDPEPERILPVREEGAQRSQGLRGLPAFEMPDDE